MIIEKVNFAPTYVTIWLKLYRRNIGSNDCHANILEPLASTSTCVRRELSIVVCTLLLLSILCVYNSIGHIMFNPRNCLFQEQQPDMFLSLAKVR